MSQCDVCIGGCDEPMDMIFDRYIREGFKSRLVTHFERVGDPDNTPLREAIDQAMEKAE